MRRQQRLNNDYPSRRTEGFLRRILTPKSSGFLSPGRDGGETALESPSHRNRALRRLRGVQAANNVEAVLAEAAVWLEMSGAKSYEPFPHVERQLSVFCPGRWPSGMSVATRTRRLRALIGAVSEQNVSVGTGTMTEPSYGGDMYYMVQLPSFDASRVPVFVGSGRCVDTSCGRRSPKTSPLHSAAGNGNLYT
jgi:hypothetical protein